MNTKYCLVTLDTTECNRYVVGALLPPTEEAYSPALDIRFNRSQSGWRDNTPHFHEHSEEFYVVLRGQMDLRVDGSLISVHAGQMLGVRAGALHQVISGVAPIESFIIRLPGGGNDKVSTVDSEPKTTTPPILLDLCQTFSDYPLGACLPEDHPNYSRLLDFTCVWDVDPTQEWRNEELHYHMFREEYYIILCGRLDFQIDSEIVNVTAGQIIGVKPYTPHRVLGGQGLVSSLFVRAPGGRGDKIIGRNPNGSFQVLK